jgi:hypothetical protein
MSIDHKEVVTLSGLSSGFRQSAQDPQSYLHNHYSRTHAMHGSAHQVPKRSTQVVGPLGTPQAFRGDMWLTRLAHSKPGQWKNKTRAGQRGSVLESADSLTHCAPKTKLRSIQR